MPRRPSVLLGSIFIATAAQAQGVLTELKWTDSGMSAVQGGVLRCDPGQDVQLNLEGEDASMQRVPLEMYAPEVESSDPAVARAAVSSSSAHIVNVRCTGDGEAWLTAETMGKRAHFGVLVGSAKRRAALSQPAPGTGVPRSSSSYASTAASGRAISPVDPQVAQLPSRRGQPAGQARVQLPTGHMAAEPLTTRDQPADPTAARAAAKKLAAAEAPTTRPVDPLPSVTFPFHELGRPLARANLSLQVVRTSISANWMSMGEETSFRLWTPNNDLPEGAYKVRFNIKQANKSGSLELTGNGVQSTCPFYAQLSYRGPVQPCEIGPIEVGPDRKLEVTGSLTGQVFLRPESWQMGDVTVWQAP